MDSWLNGELARCRQARRPKTVALRHPQPAQRGANSITPCPFASAGEGTVWMRASVFGSGRMITSRSTTNGPSETNREVETDGDQVLVRFER